MSVTIKDPSLIAALQDLARGVKSESDLAAMTTGTQRRLVP